VNRKRSRVAIGIAVAAFLLFSAWPVYNKIRRVRNADATLQARARALVEKNRQLQPVWDKAMQDGVLTYDEAKEIVEGAGETLAPEN
jgi:hypothetical protein